MTMDHSLDCVTTPGLPMGPQEALDALINEGPLSVMYEPVVDLVRGEVVAYQVLGHCGPVQSALASVSSNWHALREVARANDRLLALDTRWCAIAIDDIASLPDNNTRFLLTLDTRAACDISRAPGFIRALAMCVGIQPSRLLFHAPRQAAYSPAEWSVVEEFRSLGFGIALEDAAGPSGSLETLASLKPDWVSIRAAMPGEPSPIHRHLLGALSDFAEAAGITLAARDVGSESELRALCEAGIRYAHGPALCPAAPHPLPLPPRAARTIREIHARVAGRSAARAHASAVRPLLDLIDALSSTGPLEPVLHHVVAFAAAFLQVERVTLRLLDESRTRLLVAARAGAPIHASAFTDFAAGEGLLGSVVATGRPLRLGQARDDRRFVSKPNMLTPLNSFLGIPLLDPEGCIGVLAASSEKEHAFSIEHERRLRLLAGLVAPRLQVARLRRLARTDALTGAYNRRGLDELLPVAPLPPLAVAAVDVDRFKSINDRLGHGTGDMVLRSVVAAMRGVLRESDAVVRTGGEEFLAILPGAAHESAMAIAERLRSAVEAADHGTCAVTVSIGVAVARQGELREELTARADAALVQAKAAGRNRVQG